MEKSAKRIAKIKCGIQYLWFAFEIITVPVEKVADKIILSTISTITIRSGGIPILKKNAFNKTNNIPKPIATKFNQGFFFFTTFCLASNTERI